MLIFCATSAFRSVDLPTFGRPTIATRPHRCAGSGASAVLRGGAPRRPRVSHQDLSGLPGSSLALRASSIAARRFLLGGTARLAFARFLQAQRRHGALDLEGLGMRLAAGGDDAIARHRNAPRLQPFLQLGLGVLGPARDLGRLDHLAEQAVHQRARRGQAAVEEGRADQRLERVGEDRRAQRAAAARLAFTEAQRLGQAELERGTVQAVFANEMGADARQVAFVGVAEAVEQQARDDQAQDRVAEELEALVVVGTEAAVGERAFQQGRVAEPVADALLQCYEAGIHARERWPVAKRAEDASSSGPRT